MKTNALLTIVMSLFISHLAHSEVIESHVDFTLSPSLLSDGEIQIAFEWLTPNDFLKRDLSIMDVPRMSEMNLKNNHMIVSKLAFITNSSFDNLSYNKMNRASYISNMLNSVKIDQQATNLWKVTNQVRAYSIPFKVSFDFEFREVSQSALGSSLSKYLKDEASGFSSNSGRECFLALDMTNFSQLMYRNYSVVYMKELDSKRTLIVSGVISSFNLSKANSYFEYQPFSSSKNTMMKNVKNQTLHMAKSIQN